MRSIFSVRDNGQIKKLAAYVIPAVSLTGHKEVLSIHIGENESAKYWPGVLNELKNRGVKDILVICADGLSGMKEAVAAAYPQTELQCCIVHQVRNTPRTCLHKHMRTSFRQILPQTALKILAGRQPACGFLPCLQQNYARKSAHISYEDRF